MQLLKITTVPVKFRVEKETVTAENIQPNVQLKNAADVSVAAPAASSAQNNADRLVDKNNFRSEALRRARAQNIPGSTINNNQEDQYNVKYCYGKKNVSPDIKPTCSYINNTVVPSVSMDATLDNIDSLYPDKSWEPDRVLQDTNNDTTKVKQVRPRERIEKRVIVEEFAHVDIEYLGGFNYVPKSSAPDYVDPEDE